jgi:hypothetical protein
MPRNRLEPGTFGLVTVRRVDAGRWRASCQLRDFDGDLRYINRVASTRGRAEAAAQEAAVSMRDALVRDHEGAQERRRDAERGILPRDTDPTTVRELTIAWRQSLGENHDLHVATIRTWQWLLAAMFGEPVRRRGTRESDAERGAGPRAAFELIADKTPRSVTARDLKDVLQVVSRSSGSSTARQMRTVLSYVFGIAEDRGLVQANPVPLLKGNKGSPVIGRNKVRDTGLDHRRAPSVEIVDRLRVALRADPEALPMAAVGGRRHKARHPRACGRCETCTRYACARPKRCRSCAGCGAGASCASPKRCYRCENCRAYVEATGGRHVPLCDDPIGGARPATNGADIADLVDFLFLVGCRLGEALAVRWSDITLADGEGEVLICGTVVYAVSGGVVRQPHTKTGDDGSRQTGARSVYLISDAVDMLQARADYFGVDLDAEALPGIPVFGSPQKPGHYRDLRNTSRAIKELFSKHGVEWGRSHIGRKYLVNRLDAHGVPHVEIAKLMGWRDLNTIKSYLDEVTGVSATTKSAMRSALVRPAAG